MMLCDMQAKSIIAGRVLSKFIYKMIINNFTILHFSGINSKLSTFIHTKVVLVEILAN